MNFPVIDLHCDTVLALLGDDMNQAGSLRKNDFHIDLERASRLGNAFHIDTAHFGKLD